MQPVVSVIIPTFNRAGLLPRAIESVIAQTFGDWELIVVDDGSTDDTAGVIRPYANELGERFVYLRQRNRGSSHARNAGIEAGVGQFVAFLDSDDQFLPHKLSRQLALFASAPQLGLVYSDYAYVDLEGMRHPSAFDTKCAKAREVTSTPVGDRLRVCDSTLFDTLLEHYFISTITGMIRREVLTPALRFPSGIAYAEEWVFYLKAVACCRAGFVDEALSLHHFVEGSLARRCAGENAMQFTRTVEAIENAFPDLTARQRQILDDHKARSFRQVGYDAHRDGRYGDAARAFARSFKCAPRLGVLAETGDSLWRGLTGPKLPARDDESAVAQADGGGVR